MSLNLADDYLICDDPQTVSYYVKTQPLPPMFAQPVTVAYCQREHIDQHDLEDLREKIPVINEAAFWHFWRKPLTYGTPPDTTTIIPKINDQFVDSSGQRWNIITVFYCDLDHTGVQRWRCLSQWMK